MLASTSVVFRRKNANLFWMRALTCRRPHYATKAIFNSSPRHHLALQRQQTLPRRHRPTDRHRFSSTTQCASGIWGNIAPGEALEPLPTRKATGLPSRSRRKNGSVAASAGKVRPTPPQFFSIRSGATPSHYRPPCWTHNCGESRPKLFPISAFSTTLPIARLDKSGPTEAANLSVFPAPDGDRCIISVLCY